MTERKLVTLRTIAAIDSIPGADLIEVATIDGWKVVVKKGEFKVGDTCLYFEIDSFIKETDERFAFLMKSGVRLFNGVRGHRLKTIRLRKQLSQGMALPLSDFPELGNPGFSTDLAEPLGIVKWEPPTNADTSMGPGKRRWDFPSFIRKTDQERAQNIPQEIFKDLDVKYEISEKLDGSSTTFYKNEAKVGVCSRNVQLYETESWLQNTWGMIKAKVLRFFGVQVFKHDPTNAFVRMFIDSGMKNFLETANIPNLAFQGELISPSIQGNFHNVAEPMFFLYDIWDIDSQTYLTPYEREYWAGYAIGFGARIEHVPIIQRQISLGQLNIKTIDDLLAFADGPGMGTKFREGLVFKRLDGKFSFKVVSNHYLLKEKDA